MGFRVILDDEYFISADALNYYLQKNVKTKKGDVREKTIGAFGRNPKGLRRLIVEYLVEHQNKVEGRYIVELLEKQIAVTEECADRIVAEMEIK